MSTPPKSILTPFRIYVLAATLLVGVLIVFACRDYPLPWSDSEGLTPAVSYAHGDGFINPVHMQIRQFNPSLHYNYHGFLFQILLGKLLPAEGASSLIPSILTSIMAAVTALSAVFFYRVCTNTGRGFGWDDAVLCFMALCAQGAVMLYLSGRWEILSILVSALTVFAVWSVPKAMPVTLGIAAGIQAAISPLELELRDRLSANSQYQSAAVLEDTGTAQRPLLRL